MKKAFSLAKNAKDAKVFLGGLGVFAYMDVGEGREQDAEALRETRSFFMFHQSETWSRQEVKTTLQAVHYSV